MTKNSSEPDSLIQCTVLDPAEVDMSTKVSEELAQYNPVVTAFPSCLECIIGIVPYRVC
jgi:hypothetical protein